ncbi:MAG: hypothetical protein MI974_09260 [Chitinophagales bacterium]|nr:hypothetical protein [Chitinophagales bacterium]
MNIENIEKQFRERLEDHETFDLNADLTWKAIEVELDKKKKRRGIYFLLMSIGSLIGLSFISDTRISTKHNFTEQKSIIDITEELQLHSSDESIYHIEESSIASSQNIEQGITSTYFKFGATQESHHCSNDQNHTKPGTLAPTNKGLSLSTSTELPLLYKESELDHKKKNNSDRKNLAPTFPIPDVEKSIYDPISINVPLLKSIPFDYLVIPEPREEFEVSFNPIVTNTKPQYQLELTAKLFQITNGIHGQGSEYANLRNQSETPQPSWSVTANLWQTKPSGWLTGFGLEYQKTWVRFRYKKEETEYFTLEDIPIHFIIDAHTRDTILRQIGDVDLEEYHKRDVQHYNEFQTINLPVHFGFIKPTQRKLTYGFIGGLSFQYQMKQSGRLLAEDNTVIDFSNDSFFKRTGFSAHVQPMIIFKGENQWQLSCSPSVAFSLTNRLKSGVGITQRPFTYGISLGIARVL